MYMMPYFQGIWANKHLNLCPYNEIAAMLIGKMKKQHFQGTKIWVYLILLYKGQNFQNGSPPNNLCGFKNI